MYKNGFATITYNGWCAIKTNQNQTKSHSKHVVFLIDARLISDLVPKYNLYTVIGMVERS